MEARARGPPAPAQRPSNPAQRPTIAAPTPFPHPTPPSTNPANASRSTSIDDQTAPARPPQRHRAFPAHLPRSLPADAAPFNPGNPKRMREENSCEADSQTPDPRLPAGTRHARATARVSSVASRAGGRAAQRVRVQTQSSTAPATDDSSLAAVALGASNRAPRRMPSAGRLSAAQMQPRGLALDPLRPPAAVTLHGYWSAVAPAGWLRRRGRHHTSARPHPP